MAKLAIVEEREEDKYEHLTNMKCWQCDTVAGRELPNLSNDAKVKEIVRDVMTSLSSARQSEVKAWEEEITACEHTLMLEQAATGHIKESGLAHCQKCELKENLWLCLTCGSLGCGRQQFGGVGGNGHGLAHYEETRHPVSVKLGTITPEGTAGLSRSFQRQINGSLTHFYQISTAMIVMIPGLTWISPHICIHSASMSALRLRRRNL